MGGHDVLSIGFRYVQTYENEEKASYIASSTEI